MAAPESGKGKTAPASPPDSTPTPNAIGLLTTDHRDIAAWFADYENTDPLPRKAKLAGKICVALRVHTQIEDEIFYPASRAALNSNQETLIEGAVGDHAATKALIAEIERMNVGEPLYEARIRMLRQIFIRHAAEEEEALFPACLRTDMDMAALGARLAARKIELMRKLTRPGGHPVM